MSKDTTHISKELDLWLKERGCEIETKAVWIDHLHLGWMLKDKETASDRDNENGTCWLDGAKQILPAYSWYDILVTHAKEFWGEEFHDHSGDKGPYLSCPLNCEDFAYQRHPTQVLRHLVTNDTEDSEDYVREHSLFSNPKLPCD